MAKLNFQLPLLQSSLSHDPWTFIISINVENSAYVFVETVMYIFSGFFDE